MYILNSFLFFFFWNLNHFKIGNVLSQDIDIFFFMGCSMLLFLFHLHLSSGLEDIYPVERTEGLCWQRNKPAIISVQNGICKG